MYLPINYQSYLFENQRGLLGRINWVLESPHVCTINNSQWRTQEKNFGGVQGMGSGLVGGPGCGAPGRQRIFENLQKIP